MKINTKSIIFRTALLYVFVTVFNVSVFVLMIFENQLDLIAENAILTSQHKGGSLKYRIDDAMRSTGGMSTVAVNRILKEAGQLGIKTIALYDEGGHVFVAVVNGAKVDKKEASIEDLKMISTSITRQGFEDKLFAHKVDRRTKTISLYIPFGAGEDRIAVAAVSLEMKDIDRQMGYLYRQCAIIAILIIVIHAVFAWLITKMLLIPLRTLLNATRQISKGDLSIRVPIAGDDEIGHLASSFNEMSVAFQRMRDEAKGANPLTGLPGNITIARHIDEHLNHGSHIAVLYCDLDNFKAYNDKYGFTKGDEAILYSKDCLVTTAQRKDVHHVFVGHEGGDDFVVIMPYECWENYAKAFITTFDRGIYQFYNSVDAKNGFIESVNRQGQRQRFPLMSISIAVVTNYSRPFKRHAEMIQVAAEVKKYVKSIDGSCYALDRRTGPVGPEGVQPAAVQAPSSQAPAQGTPTMGQSHPAGAAMPQPPQQQQQIPPLQQTPMQNPEMQQAMYQRPVAMQQPMPPRPQAPNPPQSPPQPPRPQA